MILEDALRITVRFADGRLTNYEISSKELVHKLYSDDFGAPPTYLSIEGVDGLVRQ